MSVQQSQEDVLNEFLAQHPNLSKDELQQKIIERAQANAVASGQTFNEGVNRMIDEGLELAGKIIHYLRVHNERLSKLERKDRKKILLEEQKEFHTFAQVHPFVYEYIVGEQIFNRNAFKKYIRVGWGAPKSFQDQELIAKDKRNAIYIQNRKHALYYKFLLQETNKHVDYVTIDKMYEEAVEAINKDAKALLDQQEKFKADLDLRNKELNEEKKIELMNAFKQALKKSS